MKETAADDTNENDTAVDRRRAARERRSTLTKIAGAGLAVLGLGAAGTASASHDSDRHRLKVRSPSGTTLWQAAFKPGTDVRQVRNSNGAFDHIGRTYDFAYGGYVTTITGYTRNGTDAFVYTGDRADLYYLNHSYTTDGSHKFLVDGERQPDQGFGSFY